MMNKESTIAIFGSGGLAGGAIRSRLHSEGYTKLLLPRSRDLDLREQRDVRAWFGANQVDYVFLCAALVGGIMANKTRKAEFLHDNLMMQCNVIDSSYYSGVKKLLFLGTSCIYPAGRQHPLNEDELLTGPLEPTNDAYAIAKIAGIKQCDFYREQYGFDAISIMPPNLYGPGDHFDGQNGHVLAALMNRFHLAKQAGAARVECWGDGTPMREFLFSEDMADASIFFMNNYSESGHINTGTGTDITIKELAETVAKVVGFEGEIAWDTTKPNGNPRKLLDSSRANALGWKPKTSFEYGLTQTYRWYLKNV
jgi:GDP-L-fucose synthase